MPRLTIARVLVFADVLVDMGAMIARSAKTESRS
jgi:hypothetical protein